MLNASPESKIYDQNLQGTALACLFPSEKALGSTTKNHVGLPF